MRPTSYPRFQSPHSSYTAWTVQRSPLGKTLGRERMFFNLEQPVARYKTMSAIEAGTPQAS